MLERLWRTEPARVVSTVTAFLAALFAVLVAFGIDLSEAQQDAILGAIAPVVAVIVLMGEIIRGQVAPVETANERILEAQQQLPGVGEPHLLKTRPPLLRQKKLVPKQYVQEVDKT